VIVNVTHEPLLESVCENWSSESTHEHHKIKWKSTIKMDNFYFLAHNFLLNLWAWPEIL